MSILHIIFWNISKTLRNICQKNGNSVGWKSNITSLFMSFFDRPNKFIIQTAVEMGIDNAKNSRNLNQEEIKDEYEKAKKALQKWGESEEITTLYTKFIVLYEANLKTSIQATAILKDELTWKHLGDLHEAVKNGGKGLSLTDIEWLNQFALAEHGRQDRFDSQRDDVTVTLLKDWFRIYETLKQKSTESMKVSYKDALRVAFLTASTVPFTFRYSERDTILELFVTLKDNKILIGSKEHTLIGEKIKIEKISMDRENFYIPFRIEGRDMTYSEPLKKQEFLDKYLQDILDGKDIRIQWHLVHISRTGELIPRVIATQTVAQTLPWKLPKWIQLQAPIELKWSLEAYAGWNKQELGKVGKTLKNLQEELKKLWHYNWDISGIFDIATLSSVISFQKAKKLTRIDGLVGVEETIPALFNTPPKPNDLVPIAPLTWDTDTPLPNPVPAASPAPLLWTRRAPWVPTAPRWAEHESLKSPGIHEFSDALISFRKIIQAHDEKVSGKGVERFKRLLPTSESTVKIWGEVIEWAYQKIQAIASKIDPQKLWAKDRAMYDECLLEVARYYADEHSIYASVGVENRHWKNYPRSLELTGWVLRNLFVKESIVIDPPPTDAFIRTKMMSIDPETAKKFDALYGKWYSFREIMSNPTLNGAWDTIREKVLGDYEKKLQKTLSNANDRYKNGTLLIPDPPQKKAFDLMVDVMWAWGFWDAKAEDRDKRFNIAIIAGSALAGTVVALATAPVTLPGMAGAALLWGGITTVGSIVSKWKIADGLQWAQDTGFELFLNTATFWAGWLIARAGVGAWWNASLITSKYSEIAAKSGIALSEWTAGMMLWAGIEKTRAQYEGVGLSWTESMSNNFWWAFLPLTIQYRWVFKAQSLTLANRVNNNAERAQVSGSTQAVQAESRAIAAEAESLSAKVQAEQKAVWVQPAPTKGANTPEAPTPKSTPKPTETPVSYDVGNGYTLESRAGNTFIVLKDGVSQFGKPKTLAEVEQFLSTSHNTVVPDAIKAQIAARPANAPVSTPEGLAPAGVAAPRPAPDSTSQPSSGSHGDHATGTSHTQRSTVQEWGSIDISHLHTIIDWKFKALKEWPPTEIWDLSVSRQADGKIRVKGKDIDYITTEKDAKQRISTHIQASQEHYDSLLKGSIKSSLDHWPKGKQAKLTHEWAEYSLSRPKEWGDIIVTDKNGNVISGDLADAIFASNAQRILKTKVDSFLEKHGHEKAFTKVWPDAFAFKWWQEWNGNWKWYNVPIKLASGWARWLSTITLKELMQPLKSWKAVWDTFTTPGSPLAVGNNALKAIVLRDIQQEWSIGWVGKAVVGRWVMLSAVPLMTYAPMHKDENGRMQNNLKPDELLESMAYLFYGWLIWWSVASHLFTESQPLTWEYWSWTPWAEVPHPIPTKVPARTSPHSDQWDWELPPSEVQPGETRIDPISDIKTPQ